MGARAKTFQWWIPLTTVACLAAMGAWESTEASPAIAAPYHARVRQVADEVPINFGNWTGQDTPVPTAALKLLHPNVILSRSYQEQGTGERIDLLFVQCQQSRDMDGHYPPNCYPGAGWTLQSTTPATWTVDGLTIPGCEYQFGMIHTGGTQRIIVRDFFILPDGRLFPDLATFRREAAAFKVRPFGAAQVQVVFHGEGDRDIIYQQFMQHYLPLIQATRTGVIQ